MALLSGDINDFTKLDKLGEGTYGVVYKAKNNKTDELVALKQIRLEKDSDEGMPATSVREISALLELRHPNVVWLQDAIINEKGLYLVFELCTVDLSNYLETIPDGRLPDSNVKSFLFQICQGMCFCHQRRIIHRDLKPQNLLVDTKTGAIKLADFGFARSVAIPVRAYTQPIATLWYRAPELFMGATHYSIGVDIWSIACILGEMARGVALFCGDCEIDQLYSIFKVLGTPTEKVWRGVTKLSGFRYKFPNWDGNTLADKMQDCLSEAGIELLQAMLRYDPVERISARDILNHRYFDDIDTSVLPAGDFRGDLQS